MKRLCTHLWRAQAQGGASEKAPRYFLKTNPTKIEFWQRRLASGPIVMLEVMFEQWTWMPWPPGFICEGLGYYALCCVKAASAILLRG